MRTISPVLAATVFALTFMTSAFAADQQDAEAAAVNFLQAVDSPTTADTIYDSRMSAAFKGAMPKLNFGQNIGLLRLQLGGAANSRQLMGSQLMNQLPGVPNPGTYYYVRHVSMYPAAKLAQDVTVEKESGNWKVIGFMFTPVP